MARERKPYARYFYIRAHQTFWKGDPADAGSLFRTIVITSDQFNATIGHFQVYALEGIGCGIRDGKFGGVDEEPETLVDEDTNDLSKAGERFKEFVTDSETRGFRAFTLWDEIQFQARLQEMS